MLGPTSTGPPSFLIERKEAKRSQEIPVVMEHPPESPEPIPASPPPLSGGSDEAPTAPSGDSPPLPSPPDSSEQPPPQSPPPVLLPPPSPPPPPPPPHVQPPPTPQAPLPATPSPPPHKVTPEPPPSLSPPTTGTATNPTTPSPPPSDPSPDPPTHTPKDAPAPITNVDPPRLQQPPATPGVETPPVPSSPPLLPTRPAAPREPSIGVPSPPNESQNSTPMRRTPTSVMEPLGASGSEVNVPLVVGLTTGLSLLFILIAMVFLCCVKKGKKKPQHFGGTSYYTDTSIKGGLPAQNGGEYFVPPPMWATGVPPPTDRALKVPLPPGRQHLPPSSAVAPSTGSETTGSSSSSSYSVAPAHPVTPPSPSVLPQLGFNRFTFTYEELAAATGGFSQANLLGQGGFGYVHKGVLPNGKEVAVKSLKDGSGQGEREFQAEVEIISRVHHRHLVSLVGYCMAEGQRMLVYEFVPNKTLEFHLHGKDRPTMSFETRLKIALGSAKGLAYLHEDCHPKIIHRDIKAANILLDYKFEAMVADFGLAKLSVDNNTHVSTRIMGTFGYLAPEYASTGKLTEKSDVFSFGVMLLELITGRRPVDAANRVMEGSLVGWARPLLMDALVTGEFRELVDPNLEENYDQNEMTCMIECAAACVRHSARKRPKMSQIVRTLEGGSSLEDLNDGVKPGQSTYLSSSAAPPDYGAGSYSSQMRRFQKIAFGGTGDFTNSEYGQTSEYGLSPSTSSSEADDSREIRTGTGKQKDGF